MGEQKASSQTKPASFLRSPHPKTEGVRLSSQEWVPRIKALYAQTLRALAPTTHGLGAFGEYVFGVKPAAHHQVWLDFLEEQAFKRLIIVAPPGHAKSTWCSVVYPCWRIGQEPTNHILGASVTATQSQLFSVAIRDTIEGNPQFREIFPGVLPDRIKGWGEAEWFVQPHDHGDPHSTYAAAGVGGAVIGRRANEIGLDDPYDERNISTEVQRRKVFIWLGRTLRTRLVPGGRFIGVLTRWHWDDFVDVFVERRTHTLVHMKALSRGKEVWAQVHFSENDQARGEALFGDRLTWTNKRKGKAHIFIHDRGPALWPEYWCKGDLEEERENLGVPIFNCMYQGNPSALSGDLFTIDSFQDFPEVLPDFVRVKQFWDTALSQKARASYTVGVTGACDKDNNLFVLRVRRGHFSSNDHRQIIEASYTEDRQEWDKLDQVGVEKGLLSFGLLEEMSRESFVPIKEVLPKGDKVARCRPLSAKAEAGHLYVNKKALWWPAFRDELIEFDRGKWDDQVDAASGVHIMLFPQRIWKRIKFLKI